MMNDEHMQMATELNWLREKVVELSARLNRAEADRDTLAADVKAWRDADASHELLEVIDVCDVYGHRHAVEKAEKEVDASGALTRAKADK